MESHGGQFCGIPRFEKRETWVTRQTSMRGIKVADEPKKLTMRERDESNMTNNLKESTHAQNAALLFRNYYCCPREETNWHDDWYHTCNDRCPTCDLEVEPYLSEDVLVLPG